MMNLLYLNENDITFTFEDILKFFDCLVDDRITIKLIYAPRSKEIIIVKGMSMYTFKAFEPSIDYSEVNTLRDKKLSER